MESLCIRHRGHPLDIASRALQRFPSTDLKDSGGAFFGHGGQVVKRHMKKGPGGISPIQQQ